MTRRTSLYLCSVVLAAAGCEATVPPSTEAAVDCTVSDAYEFRKISLFDGTDSGWYVYTDPTKAAAQAAADKEVADKEAAAEKATAEGAPSVPAADPVARATKYGIASQAVVPLDAPGRCGSTTALRLEAHGYNFWGAGFADWGHEGGAAKGVDDDGKEYEGISFWARSAPNSEKTFLLFVDDGRTVVLTRAKPVVGVVVDDECLHVCAASTVDRVEPIGDGIAESIARNRCIIPGGPADTGVGCSTLPEATSTDDNDANGDKVLGPGEIAAGTTCRIPPPQSMGDPTCYGGGVQPPAAATRVPASDECGNQFHTFVTTTDEWKFYTIPWSELVQWPCPNRKVGGIDKTDIRKFEIKFRQGTSYEVWIDDLMFYRRRANASQ